MLKFIAIYFVCLVICTQCSSPDSSQIESGFTGPQTLETPENIEFERLLFDYNFNTVPKEANPSEYKKENSLDQSNYFALSNDRKYGPSYTLNAQEDLKEKWVRVSFDITKPSGYTPDPQNHQGFLVISVERPGLDSFVAYNSYPIQKMLERTNRQMIDKWQHIDIWYSIPDALSLNDNIKMYHWNPSAGNIHIDNFNASIWSPKIDLTDFGLSHSVYENNYEDERMKNVSTEKAARGIRSIMISKENQFGKGFSNTIMGMNAERGDYIHVSLQALKYHHCLSDKQTARLVFTIRDTKYFYKTFSIDTRIWEDDSQLEDAWKKLEYWLQIPMTVSERDKIEIYTFNPHINPVFIDDIRIDVWKPKKNL